MVYLAGSQVEGAGSAAVSQALEAAPAVAAPLRVHPAQSTRTPTEDPTLRSQLLCADRVGAGWRLKCRTPHGNDHFLCALEKNGA